MLLAASLVGINSAADHQPVATIAQPQPQQPQTQKPILPNTQILGQAKPSVPGADIVTREVQEQRAMADRLFPFILQKLDGKTLAQKIDATTLVQKMNGAQLAALLQKADGRTLAALLQKADGQFLAQKVFPYLDITASVNSKYGATSVLDVNDIAVI